MKGDKGYNVWKQTQKIQILSEELNDLHHERCTLKGLAKLFKYHAYLREEKKLRNRIDLELGELERIKGIEGVV